MNAEYNISELENRQQLSDEVLTPRQPVVALLDHSESPSALLNSDQRSYMEYINSLPPESRCYCGWYKLGECYHCPPGKTCADKLRDRGNSVVSSVCECNDSQPFASGHGEQGEPSTGSGYQAPPAGIDIRAALAEALDIPPSTMAGIPAQSSVASDGGLVRSGEPAPSVPRKSSVPEEGFKRPRSAKQYRELADKAADILSNVFDYLTPSVNEPNVRQARTIIADKHSDLCQTFCWMTRMSYFWDVKKKQAGAA